MSQIIISRSNGSKIVLDTDHMVAFGGLCECGGTLYYDRRTDDMFCDNCGSNEPAQSYFAYMDAHGEEPLRALYQDRIDSYFE